MQLKETKLTNIWEVHGPTCEQIWSLGQFDTHAFDPHSHQNTRTALRTVVVVLAVRLQTLGNVTADLLHGLLPDLVCAQRGGHRSALDRPLTERALIGSGCGSQ